MRWRRILETRRSQLTISNRRRKEILVDLSGCFCLRFLDGLVVVDFMFAFASCCRHDVAVRPPIIRVEDSIAISTELASFEFCSGGGMRV